MRDIFNNYSSLKPLKHLKANPAGKFTLFISAIHNDLLKSAILIKKIPFNIASMLTCNNAERYTHFHRQSHGYR